MKIAINLQRSTLVLVKLAVVMTAITLLSSQLFAFDNYKEFKQNNLNLEVSGNYFSSDSNYISLGSNTSSLGSGNYYRLLDANLGARYSTDSASYFLMSTLSSAESRDFYFTRTNTSLTQIVLGMDFMMLNSIVEIVPELTLVVPLNSVSATADRVINSEGVYEAQARLNLQKDLGQIRGYTWAGFDFRSDGRSFLFPWGIGLNSKMGALGFGGEIFGAYSITNDVDTDVFKTVMRQNTVSNVDAGSYKFYYPNPSIIDSQIYISWDVAPEFLIQLNGGTTLAGENSAAGYHVGAALKFSFDADRLSLPKSNSNLNVNDELPTVKPRTSKDVLDSEMSSEKKVNNFKEEVSDGVDQNLFKPQPTKKAKTVDEEIQQQMNKTEFEIELRHNKNKKKKK